MPSQNKALEIQFFDELSQSADYDVLGSTGYNRILKEFRSHIDPKRHRTLIDLGTGSGVFLGYFLDTPMQLYGIDISPVSINRAKQNIPQANISVGDIENLQFADNSMDVVVLSGVLHHFPDTSKVVSEAWRILSPGGVILAYDPHRGNPVVWAYRCKASPFYSSNGVTENEQPLSKRAVRDAFSPCENAEISVWSISGIPYRYIASPVARLFLSLYNLVDKYIFDCPGIRNYVGAFLITAVKKPRA